MNSEYQTPHPDPHTLMTFLTYINDLPDCVASSETKLFADDSLLFH